MRQFLGAQAQRTLEHQIPGGPLFLLPVREVVEGLEKHHLELDDRVSGVPAPIHGEVFQDGSDKGEGYGPVEIGKKVGAPTQQLVVAEVAQEGAVSAAGLDHVVSRGRIIMSEITI